jgi:hypothetical protein
MCEAQAQLFIRQLVKEPLYVAVIFDYCFTHQADTCFD